MQEPSKSIPADSQSEMVDIKNLCSRKLLELVRTDSLAQQQEAIAHELQQRRHYLDELRQALNNSSVRH